MTDEHESKEAVVSLSLPRDDWTWLLCFLAVSRRSSSLSPGTQAKLTPLVTYLDEQYRRHKPAMPPEEPRPTLQKVPRERWKWINREVWRLGLSVNGLQNIVNAMKADEQRRCDKAAQAVGTATDAATVVLDEMKFLNPPEPIKKKRFQECPQCKGSRLEKFCEAIPCTKCDGTGFYPVITCRVVNAGKGEPPPFDFEDDE